MSCYAAHCALAPPALTLWRALPACMQVSATDNHTGEKVAIKRINDVFEHVSDATRILREIKLLRLLKHPDVVEIKHIMLPPHKKEFRDIYVVFELMETDLHQVRAWRRTEAPPKQQEMCMPMGNLTYHIMCSPADSPLPP